MPNHTRENILEIISNWSTDDVVELLQKNELSECCDAVVKRQVDGDGLLQLSERSLNLWKSDLTTSLRRGLCRFVEELKNNPNQYFQEEHGRTSPSLGESDVVSDLDTWDTDFEDDEAPRSLGRDSPHNGDYTDYPVMYTGGNTRPYSRAGRGIPENRTSRLVQDDDEDENLYANGSEFSGSNGSPVNATTSSGTNIVAQLKEQLRLQTELRSKPRTGPNSNLIEKNPNTMERKPELIAQKSRILEQNSETTEWNSKMEEQKPKLMQTPNQMDQNSKRMEQKPKLMQKPNQMEQNSKRMEQKPKVMQKPNQMEQNSKRMEQKPKVMQKLNQMEQNSKRMEQKPKVMQKLNQMEQNSKRMEQKPKLMQKPNQMEQNSERMQQKPNKMEQNSKIIKHNQNITEQKSTMMEQEKKIVDQKPEVKEFPRNKQTFLHPTGKRSHSPESNRNIQAPRTPQLCRSKYPPKPKVSPPITPVSDNRNRNLPKPPPYHIPKLDLVADLPPEPTEDSDECVYEPIEEQAPVRRHLSVESMRSGNSTQSLALSGRSMKGSNESVDHPRSIGSADDNQEADVYESIPENIDDNGYVPPIFNRGAASTLPHPPPSRPKATTRSPIGRQLLGGIGSRLADEATDMIVRIKRGLLRCCHGQPRESPDTPEPPKPPAARRQASLSECLTQAALTQARENLAKRPETNNKFATFPHGSSQSSGIGGAARPLPPPPDVQRPERLVDRAGRNFEVSSYTERPWFHNVTREEAIALIQDAYSNPHTNPPPDGYFLLRPSRANMNQPWTLVVWYRNKTYNIAVRERPDCRYALGKVKPREQSFASIEEMVNFYQHTEELVLNSATGDAQVGSTRLTETPPKRTN